MNETLHIFNIYIYNKKKMD